MKYEFVEVWVCGKSTNFRSSYVYYRPINWYCTGIFWDETPVIWDDKHSIWWDVAIWQILVFNGSWRTEVFRLFSGHAKILKYTLDKVDTVETSSWFKKNHELILYATSSWFKKHKLVNIFLNKGQTYSEWNWYCVLLCPTL